MSLIKANGAGEVSTGFFNNVATQSLRFDDGSSSHLTSTPSASNRKTHVLSMWVKRCELGGGSVNNSLFRANGSGDTGRTDIFFDANDKLNVAGSSTYFRITNQVFRDTSAWYHLVFALDTTQTTLSNNFLIYLNGSQITSFANYNDYALNTDYGINGNVAHQIGTGYDYFDGYMAEINFIDGLSFYSDTSGTPNTSFNINSFGELKNGVWIPKAYTGSYGTNGFRLAFDSADLNDAVNPITDPYGSATDVPVNALADASGQGNHFDSSGIDTEDCGMLDSPENNFCTYNPLDPKGNDNTFSEGNLKVVVNAQNTDEETTGTFAVSSGKWYWEIRANSSTTTGGYFKIGLRGTDADGSNWTVRGNDGETKDASGSQGSSTVSYTTNNVIGIYLDMDNSKWYVSVDGVLQNSANLTNGTGFIHNNLTGELRPFILNATSGGTHTVVGNFGQDSTFAGEESAGGNADSNGNGDFHSAVTSPYLALCSANISDDDLPISPNADTEADDHFTPIVYAGNSTDGHLVPASGDTPDSISFAPDWIWIKNRDTTHTHILVDSVRGVNAGYLTTENTNTESGNNSLVKTIETSSPFGFTLAIAGAVNTTYDYVAWVWKAGGTASTIAVDTYSAGVPSIASSVSANTDAGFSIVTYNVNTASVVTVGHGLTKAPELIINKGRDSSSAWWTFTTVIDGTLDYLRLDEPNAKADDSLLALPTPSVFSQVQNYTLQQNVVSYCFHSVEGFSKFGSYTGGGTEFPFVYLGFRPSFLMVKNADVANSWRLWDSARNEFNLTSKYLTPDTNGAEGSINIDVDFLSNGFKLRGSNSGINGSTNNIIFMAFAENPFKYANAR